MLYDELAQQWEFWRICDRSSPCGLIGSLNLLLAFLEESYPI